MGAVLDTIWEGSLKTPRVRELLELFESFPGLEKWTPKRHEWQRLLFWALILEKVGRLNSMDELVESFCKHLLRDNRPDLSTISEMSGAALVHTFGWNVEKIPRTHEKTPDFLVSSKTGVFELEITKADPKEVHTKLAEYGDRLLSLTVNKVREHDIVIMLADILSDGEEVRLQEAVEYLKVRQSSEVEGLWRLVAEPYGPRSDDYIKLRDFHDLPPWWPSKFKTEDSLKIRSSVTFEKDTPATTIVCAVPIRGYLNPLRKKVGHFQGSRQNPLLLGIDVEALPGAFKELDYELPRRFKRWRHLSGVLAYEPNLRTDRIGWKFKLYKNSAARLPLPSGLPLTAGWTAESLLGNKEKRRHKPG